MRSQFDLEASLRRLLELTETGLQVGTLEPYVTGLGGESLFIALRPAEWGPDRPGPALELERTKEGRIKLNLLLSFQEEEMVRRVDTWFGEHVSPTVGDLLRRVWGLARSQSVSDTTELALDQLEDELRKVVL